MVSTSVGSCLILCSAFCFRALTASNGSRQRLGRGAVADGLLQLSALLFAGLDSFSEFFVLVVLSNSGRQNAGLCFQLLDFLFRLDRARKRVELVPDFLFEISLLLFEGLSSLLPILSHEHQARLSFALLFSSATFIFLRASQVSARS